MPCLIPTAKISLSPTARKRKPIMVGRKAVCIMKTPIFTGSGVAIVTPFDESGINFKKLEELFKFHLDNKTDAIIVCGTTGEASAMSEEEQKSVLEFSIKKMGGKIKMIAGTGSNNTEKAIRLTKFADELGYDGALLVTPYYNKTTQRGLVEHYGTIAKCCNIPMILYNVPSRTGVSISLDTLKILDDTYDNIVAVKEASGDVAFAAKIKAETNLAIYSGNDDVTLPILSVGGIGVISVVANILPYQMHKVCKDFESGDLMSSQKLFLSMLDVMSAMFVEVNPIPVKTAMNIMGFDVGKLRLPLYEMEEGNIEKLKIALKNFY